MSELQQSLQEEEYKFPYHYVPSFRDDFRLTFFWKWGYQYAATLKYLIEETGQFEFSSFIDVGCGDGRLIKELCDIYPNKTLKGIDTSKRAIALARALNPGLDFEAVDVNHCTGKYDVVSLIEVIEHIPTDELDSFLKSALNLLADGGFIILTAPSINKKLSKKHFQHFSQESLCSLLDPYVEIIKMHYLHAPNRLLKLLLKLLYNRYFFLNYQPLLNWIFNYYYRNRFIDFSGQGHRLYVLAKK